MANVSLKQLEEVKEKAIRLQKRLAGAQEKGEEIIGTVVQTAEIGMTSFGFGFARGRWGETTVLGVPVDLGFGLASHVGAFFGFFGKYAEHGHNLGDGAIAEYLAVKGALVGDKMRQKAGEGPPKGHAIGPSLVGAEALPQHAPSVAMADVNAAVEAATRAAVTNR